MISLKLKLFETRLYWPKVAFHHNSVRNLKTGILKMFNVSEIHGDTNSTGDGSRPKSLESRQSISTAPSNGVGSGAKSRSGFPPCEYDEHLCTRHHNNE